MHAFLLGIKEFSSCKIKLHWNLNGIKLEWYNDHKLINVKQ